MLIGDRNFGNTVSASLVTASDDLTAYKDCLNYCLRHFPQGWATICSTGPKDTRSSGSGEQSPFER